jgi:tripartite-type tricarboxylate transporter receptor subunit TctC
VEIVQRLYAEIGKALQDPELLHNLRAAGIAPSLLGPQELGTFVRAEHAKWGRVIRDTGATIN